MRALSLRVASGLVCFWIAIFCALAASIGYPPTRKVEQIDEYHGVKVADPYRWLEDDPNARRSRSG